MKKLAKLLAWVMVMAIAFGMTVSASGNDVTNPSPSVPAFGIDIPAGTDGIEVVDLTSDEEAALEEAFSWTGKAGVAVKAVRETYGAVYVDRVNSPFSLRVTKEAKLTLRNVPLPKAGDGYGYVYGYVLVHLTGKELDSVELIPMTLNADEDGYNVTVSSGSPFQVARWTLQVHDTKFGSVEGANIHTNPVYQNQHIAARKAIEVNGIGDEVARALNKDYRFYQTMDSVLLNLEEERTVNFPLPDIEDNYSYIVLCYNDMWNIAGFPDSYFALDRVAEGTYAAEMPKGEYFAIVIKAASVPGPDPTPVDPAPGPDNPNPAPGEDAAFTTDEGIQQNPFTESQIEEIKEACGGLPVADALKKIFGSVYKPHWLGNPVDFEVTVKGRIWVWNLPAPNGSYNYSYGYAMVHFKGGKLDMPEIIRLTWDEAKKAYYADVESGSPYQLFQWNLQLHSTTFASGVTGATAAADTYQNEHTAARQAIEIEGNGNTVAQHYKTGEYQFVETIGSVNLSMDNDGTVQFTLPDIDGNYEYVVLCYDNDQEGHPDIQGYPDRHFGMTRVAKDRYTADLPKGKYTAVVILVKNVPGSGAPGTPQQPVTSQPTQTAPAVDTLPSAQTGAAVSPKTGQMLSMAVILAAICLAGAAVCAMKARRDR